MACKPDKVNREVDLSDVKASLEKVKNHCNSTSVSWAQDLFQKADEDKKTNAHKGNYLGYVSAIKVQNKNLLYTNFMMGSGGVAFYTIDCEGNPYSNYSMEFLTQALEQGKNVKNVIYSNFPSDVVGNL